MTYSGACRFLFDGECRLTEGAPFPSSGSHSDGNCNLGVTVRLHLLSDLPFPSFPFLFLPHFLPLPSPPFFSFFFSIVRFSCSPGRLNSFIAEAGFRFYILSPPKCCGYRCGHTSCMYLCVYMFLFCF